MEPFWKGMEAQVQFCMFLSVRDSLLVEVSYLSRCVHSAVSAEWLASESRNSAAQFLLDVQQLY